MTDQKDIEIAALKGTLARVKGVAADMRTRHEATLKWARETDIDLGTNDAEPYPLEELDAILSTVEAPIAVYHNMWMCDDCGGNFCRRVEGEMVCENLNCCGKGEERTVIVVGRDI